MISEELERGRRKNQESERGLGVVFMKKKMIRFLYII
jgi:hypothetical protein